ncbi:MAG: EpsG family protein [Oliverpabstia sp.]
MTLTNYWWLLLWLVIAGGILAITVPRQPVQIMGKIEYRWSMTTALILACPYAIWAMNRSNFGDTEVYRKTFHDVPASMGQLVAYLSEHTKDQGFSVLMSFLKTLIGNNDKLFFLVIAVFQIFCVVYFFRKYSTNFLLCMFMFVASTDYLSWMFNGMRQFIAVCMILLSFELILKKKYVPVIGIILLASTIHGSALIMLPIVFIVQGRAWNRRTMVMLAGIVAAVLFIDQFTNIMDSMLAETQYNDLITNDIWTNDDGTNMLRVLFYSIPAILSLIGKRYVDEADSPLINVCVNCAACTSFLYILSAFSSGIYIGRIPIYTTLSGYAAVPWLIDHMFTKDSAKIVTFGLICGFLAFFYYQMHVAWGIL